MTGRHASEGKSTMTVTKAGPVAVGAGGRRPQRHGRGCATGPQAQKSRFDGGRSYVSENDWRNPRVRVVMKALHAFLLVMLLVVGIGPMLLLAKYAITPTQDIIRTPLAIFPNGVRWENISEAWNDVQISKYFLNTIWLAAGSWFVQMLVATTGGFVLSVLRPAWAQVRLRSGGRDPVRAERRAPRAAVPHDPQSAGCRHVADQQLLGRLAAVGRERVQRRADDAVLRRPSA